MRFLSAICLLLLLCVPMWCQDASAAAPANPSSAEDTDDNGKDVTDSVNSVKNAQAAARAGKQTRSLLPERPKDFNPMMPPVETMQDNPPPQMGGMIMPPPADNAEAGHLVYFARWMVMLAAGGGLLLFLTLIYLRSGIVLTHKTLSLAAENADTAMQALTALQENGQKELRAYVFASGAKGEIARDKHYGVRVEMRNFGKTPAYNVNGWMTVFVDDFTNEREFASLPRDYVMVETVLPPGGLCFYYAITQIPIVRELKAIEAGTRAIYACGEIRYKDVFGGERYSRFRIKCAGERNLSLGSFDHCAGGNDAT